MEKSASAPYVELGSAATLTTDVRKKYNIKQYKGLVGSISDVKKTIDRERREANEKQEMLELRMKQNESESALVQKELSVQLRCAGRSYQQLLGATRDLTEQLRVEEDRRLVEIEALEKQIKDLKLQLSHAAKPWKEEVAKRDLKILKLQEAAVDQEARLKTALGAIAPVEARAAEEIRARDEQFEIVISQISIIKADYEQQLVEKDEIYEIEVERAKKEMAVQVFKIKDIEEKASKIAGPFEKQIKDLHKQIQGLENQLSKVDYTPYEEKLRLREIGYEKLVKDFQVKQGLNYENIERMRAGFEITLERMDKKIQENEAECKKRLKPWTELVEKREREISQLNERFETLKVDEKAYRERQGEILAEVTKERDVARKAEELARQEAQQFKLEAQAMKESRKSDTTRKKIQMLQLKLDEVTKRCETTVRQKDREIKQKTDTITNLQQRVKEEVKDREELDNLWDHRVQKKEEGYGLVCANLAFAEGQILEERRRTEVARETIRRRERSIERLNNEHVEELGVRLDSHQALSKHIRDLEGQLDQAQARLMKERNVRTAIEIEFDRIRKRYEDQVADLRVEMVRRDKQRELVEKELEDVRKEFEKSREDWCDKQRDLDDMVRARDRLIISLKNEIEFINDSWEVKYNRLMQLFEKLQKKYEECVGPGGAQEAQKRTRDLKIEIERLVKEILDLKEMIKKQKRQIRDLQLDYDILVKETADIIAEKERGIAEMVGDMAKLENRLRAETELRERLVREITAEKMAIVASFEGRIRQLEQQVMAMRFTDREELLDTIDVWKRAYERVCLERDELEDYYKDLLDLKDRQVIKMAQEYAELQDRITFEQLKGQQSLEECEDKWKKMQAKWGIQEMELQKQIKQLSIERDQAIRERDRERGIADSRAIPDPELDVLRAKVKEKEQQLASVEAGIANIVADNCNLRDEINNFEVEMEQAQANIEPQIRWREERYEAMVKEHDDIKKVLQMELLRAQETCKTIEEQVRKFPQPFEQELKEAEDKYAQSQAGLIKLSSQNVTLKQQMLDEKEGRAKDVALYEEQLALAATILREVGQLGLLKNLPAAQISELESALGVDLDGDGSVR